jgi:hypothetical protein
MTSITLVDESRPATVGAVVRGDAIRLSPETVATVLGWELGPEGLCRGDTCVPVRDRGALVHEDGVDLAALCRLLDRPLAMEPVDGIAVVGASAADRAGRLASMDAPDFTLPDLAGRRHSLGDHRGRKVLLVAWASW